MTSLEQAFRTVRTGEALDGGPRIAVLVPCHNEEHTVATVVEGFAEALPGAQIYVYDNRSSDATAERAAAAGAVVRREPRPGKGNVMRRMFSDIDADIYVMVDGDATYDASAAPAMVDLLVSENLDMVVGCRRPIADDDAVYRRGHTFGNLVFTKMVRILFGGDFSDVFSGYRVLSRRLVKSFPVRSEGFEIETELTAHAVQVSAACAEIQTDYGSRHVESDSKLRTYRDGVRILTTAVRLFKEMRPLQFFGGFFVFFTIIAVALGVPIIDDYVRTGLVPRFPTAILAAAIQVVAFICLTCGLVLQSVVKARQEARQLVYLQLPSVANRRNRSDYTIV